MEPDRLLHPLPTARRPLKRRSLHAEAVETLREMIIGGQLAPGARLVEAELCEMFTISRTPLREALRVLEVEGLVTFYPNRGAVVSIISATEEEKANMTVANYTSLLEAEAAKRATDGGGGAGQAAGQGDANERLE